MNAHMLADDGTILNTIVVDNLDVFPNLIDASIGGVAGDKYDKVNNVIIPAVPVIPIPQSVSMRQARLALLQGGYLTNVVTYINGLSGAEGQTAQITWEYASAIDRQDPMVALLGGVLSLTDAQLDQLFILANTL